MYPDKDWKIVADRLWPWTEMYWDEAQEESDQVIPEYIMAFDSYEETNRRCFEGKLSKELYDKLMLLYDGITEGNTDDEINQVLFTTVDWATVCDGASFAGVDEITLDYLDWMEEVLNKHSIELPKKELLADMTKDQKNGWGDFCNCRHLSIILKDK